MEIEKKVFIDFLDKVSIDNRVWNGILNFKEEGLSCHSTTEDTTIGCIVKLNKKGITNYEAIGKIGLKDINFIKKCLRTFTNKTTFAFKDGGMLMKEKNREINTRLADPEFIETDNEFELDLDYKNTFKIKNDVLQKVLNSIKIFGDKEYGTVSFITTKGKLRIKIELNEDTITDEIAIPMLTEETHVKVRTDILKNILSTISADDVKISMITDAPIRFEETLGDIMKVEYFIAPHVENEEEKPKERVEGE